jgi:ADP-ribose pyrophosphatase
MTVPEIIGREVLLENEWIQVAAKLVRGMAGSTEAQRYFVVRPRDYVSIVALTTDQRLVLVRQYRPAVERMTLELPSGLVDAGELPEVSARRELLEETGYVAERFEHIGTLIPDSGRYENRLWCYAARDVRRSSAMVEVEAGLEAVLVDVSRLAHMLETSEFDHALHLAALMLAVASGHLVWLRP